MSGALQAAAGPSSDRASVFAMGTLMGVAVAGAGALALSYYARAERERFAADAREPRGEAAIGRRRERRRGIAIARDRGGGDERDERKDRRERTARRARGPRRDHRGEREERALEERARARVTI